VFGIITAHSPRRRTFTDHDVAFLESVASVVSAVLDRRETQQQLLDANERLRLAMDAGRMGTWEWRISANEVIWSESLERMHEMEPGSFAGTFEAFARDIHPDDRERVFDTIQHSVSTGEHELEYRIILPDGTTRWLSAAAPCSGMQTAAGLMIGVCSDITGKQANGEGHSAQAEHKALLAERLILAFPGLPDDAFSLAHLCVPYLGDWCASTSSRRNGAASPEHSDPPKLSSPVVHGGLPGRYGERPEHEAGA
jgi:hypothetical protein